MGASNRFRFIAGIAVGIAAAALLFRNPLEPFAVRAGEAPTASTILAVPVQINRENQGIALIDTRNRTIWVYEFFDRQTGFKQIRLMAARSWEYDRLLTEWNSADPTPQQIRSVLENIHQKQMLEAIQPTPSETEKKTQSQTELIQ